eukprot:scaffold105525_cov40-Cyclotella_meneghiniana.AAC.1
MRTLTSRLRKKIGNILDFVHRNCIDAIEIHSWSSYYHPIEFSCNSGDSGGAPREGIIDMRTLLSTRERTMRLRIAAELSLDPARQALGSRAKVWYDCQTVVSLSGRRLYVMRSGSQLIPSRLTTGKWHRKGRQNENGPSNFSGQVISCCDRNSTEQPHFALKSKPSLLTTSLLSGVFLHHIIPMYVSLFDFCCLPASDTTE